MQKIFQSILSKRKCRSLAAGAALWLLRQVYEVEKGEMHRFSDMLDSFDAEPGSCSRREYAAIEEECLESECALGFLDCAIVDLGFAY